MIREVRSAAGRLYRGPFANRSESQPWKIAILRASGKPSTSGLPVGESWQTHQTYSTEKAAHEALDQIEQELPMKTPDRTSPKKRPSKRDLAVARIPEGGQITDWVHKCHHVARACQAYAVFFGAMAGQGLLRLRQVVGSRNFKPALDESMPWLSRSTAYLYMGYAERFAKKLKAILPTVGQIDLKTLPDPRDWEAAEKTGLFKEAKRALNTENYGQLLLALDLMREPKRRGGHHPKGEEAPPDTDDPEVRYYLSLTPEQRVAHDRWAACMETLRTEGVTKKSWMDLPPGEYRQLRGLVMNLRALMSGAAAEAVVDAGDVGAADAGY